MCLERREERGVRSSPERPRKEDYRSPRRKNGTQRYEKNNAPKGLIGAGQRAQRGSPLNLATPENHKNDPKHSSRSRQRSQGNHTAEYLGIGHA
jgi:hypothetical protein